MKVLIIGSGGREHAMAWKIAQSSQVSHVWVAPGNAGTQEENKVENIAILPTQIDELCQFAKKMKIDLTIVGPEVPLALGITDTFNRENLKIFGPTQAAAQLETSKKFAKEFMQQQHIPTAAYASFNTIEPAISYLEKQSLPIVIKADGLAAGKGVIITDDLSLAKQTIIDMLSGNSFGAAGKCVVIEEFLTGSELSYIVMIDGTHVLALASSKDHKRRDNGDLGPNTGGMGAVSPSPLLTDTLEKEILAQVIYPVITGMKARGIQYCGFLYAGLMITPDGKFKVLEFNCRMGDPETQAILPRLQSDLAELCLLATEGRLNQATATWSPYPAITVVMTAGGYPDTYLLGDIIQGLKKKNTSKLFHAATKYEDGHVITQGGRVLSVTAMNETLQLAYENAYNAVKQITWHNCYYRTDIGLSCMKPAIST